MTITLRGYQNECIEAVLQAKESGITRQVVCLPTGCGKTITFAELARKMNVKTLILAHRDELLNQAIEKIKLVWDEVDIGKVKAEQNEFSAQVVVASVQSAMRDGRLQQLVEQNFELIIVDECHHSSSDSYQKIIDAINPKLLVGFTATVNRADGKGLDSTFSQIVFERSLPEMISAGYLCDLEGQKVLTKVDLSSVKTSMGDFQVSQLSEAVNTPARNTIIVKSYKKHSGKPAIAFCVDIQHSQDLADAFNASGVSATAVWGTMPEDERSKALQDFKDGTVKILTNCNVLTEGFDEPSIQCIIMARPTKSTSLYTQMVGRGTRLFPGKDSCLVIDFHDSKHDICSLGNLAGKEVKAGQSLLETIREKEVEDKIAAETLRIEQEVEFDILGRSQFSWVAMGNGEYKLPLDKALTIYMRQQGKLYIPQLYKDFVLVKELSKAMSLEYATGIAEDYVRRENLGDRNAYWRRKKGTAAQKKMLDKSHVTYKANITMGEASDLISVLVKDAWKFELATTPQRHKLRGMGSSVTPSTTKGEASRIIGAAQYR